MTPRALRQQIRERLAADVGRREKSAPWGVALACSKELSELEGML